MTPFLIGIAAGAGIVVGWVLVGVKQLLTRERVRLFAARLGPRPTDVAGEGDWIYGDPSRQKRGQAAGPNTVLPSTAEYGPLGSKQQAGAVVKETELDAEETGARAVGAALLRTEGARRSADEILEAARRNAAEIIDAAERTRAQIERDIAAERTTLYEERRKLSEFILGVLEEVDASQNGGRTGHDLAETEELRDNLERGE